MQPWKAWGNLDNITLEPLRTFYNVTLGTLKEPLQYYLGNLGKLGNLQGTLKKPWRNLEGTFWEPWQSNLGNLLETFTMSPWEPGPRLLGNLYIIILGTLTTFTWKTWDPCREPWRNLEGTFWEPFGNREGTLRNLGNLERTLGTLGTLSEPWEPWEPWEPLLENLGTFTWEPGNLYLGTFTWEPGNLYLGTFTWNLGTLGEWVLELLRSAPKPLLWLKTPKHSAVGEKGTNISMTSYGVPYITIITTTLQDGFLLQPSGCHHETSKVAFDAKVVNWRDLRGMFSCPCCNLESSRNPRTIHLSLSLMTLISMVDKVVEALSLWEILCQCCWRDLFHPITLSLLWRVIQGAASQVDALCTPASMPWGTCIVQKGRPIKCFVQFAVVQERAGTVSCGIIHWVRVYTYVIICIHMCNMYMHICFGYLWMVHLTARRSEMYCYLGRSGPLAWQPRPGLPTESTAARLPGKCPVVQRPLEKMAQGHRTPPHVAPAEVQHGPKGASTRGIKILGRIE